MKICFPNKGESLVPFHLLDPGRNGPVGYLFGVGFDPQRNRAMMHAQMLGNPAQAHAIRIQLGRFPPDFFWIRPGFRLWRVFDVTEHAAITLAAAAGFPGSVLSFGSATSWTLYHVAILAHF